MPPDQHTPDLHTVTGGYAADVLDDDERLEFEDHLVSCAACQEEVRTLRETVAVMAAALAVTPPVELKRRVLAEIAATRQRPPLVVETSVRGRRARRDDDAVPGPRRRSFMIAAAAAAGFGVGAVGLYRAREADREAAEARQQADAVAAVLTSPRARRSSGPVAGGGTVDVVVLQDRAVVVAAGVPALPSERTYQLWLLRGDQVTSAGLGPVGEAAAGSWVRLIVGISPGDAVALSVEPSGGSPRPTTTPVTVIRT